MANSKWYKLVIPHTNLKIHPHTYLPLQVLKNSIQISNHRNLPSYLIKRPFQFIKPLIVPRIANSLILSIILPSKIIKIEISIFHVIIHNQWIFPKFLPFSEFTFVVKKFKKLYLSLHHFLHLSFLHPLFLSHLTLLICSTFFPGSHIFIYIFSCTCFIKISLFFHYFYSYF